MHEIIFKNLKIQHLVKPSIKHSYISIDKEGKILLKTPKVSKFFINNLLEERQGWIEKKLSELKEKPPIYLTLENINSKDAQQKAIDRVEYFSNIMKLTYSNIKFRKMKRRWGSCDSKGVITLNKKLMLTPQICIDYVIIHELAHLKHLNHSKKFHALVEKYCDFSVEAKEMLSRVVFS